MDKISNLRDLLIQEGRELYNSSTQELNTLKKIETQATSPELKSLITTYTQRSTEQLLQLKEIFNELHASWENGTCETTRVILERTQRWINICTEKEVRDAAIVNSLQQLMHRKISGYSSCNAYAKQLEENEVANIFYILLRTESRSKEEFNDLSDVKINKYAMNIMA